MVINFKLSLKNALASIGNFSKKEFIIYPEEKERTYETPDAWLERYHEAKVEIVELINTKYDTKYSLEQDDEVSSFLKEAGSNALSNSQFKCVYTFELYLGSKGFMIGVVQKGRGFDATRINEEKIKDNKGLGFEFYRRCEDVVFFDEPTDARAVYFMRLL